MKEEQKKLGLNIQLFAEEGDEGQPAEPKEPAKILTFEEMLSKENYQCEFDKRVAKSIETAKLKWEDDYKQKLEAEKTEAERLAKLTEEEKVKEQLAQKDKRIAELEAKDNARNLKDETLKILTEKEIPLNYIDLFDFNTNDAKTISAKIDILSNNLSKDKEIWLNNALKQQPPKENKGGTSENKPTTYEDFLKLEEK